MTIHHAGQVTLLLRYHAPTDAVKPHPVEGEVECEDGSILSLIHI